MKILPFLCMAFLALCMVDVAIAAGKTDCKALRKDANDAFEVFVGENYKDTKQTKNLIDDEDLEYFIKQCKVSRKSVDSKIVEDARTKAQYIQLSRSLSVYNQDPKKVRDKLVKCISDPKEPILLPYYIDDYLGYGASGVLKLVQYNLKTKKASVNEVGVGAGITFRVYPPSAMAPFDNIHKIALECRATTAFSPSLKSNLDGGSIAFPSISFTPAMFVSKAEEEKDINLQPAIVVGLLGDSVNLGIGFNLAGPRKNKGQVFLLAGFGLGVQF